MGFVFWPVWVVLVVCSLPTSGPGRISCRERSVELPVGDRNMGQNLEFMVDHQCQCGGLHSPERVCGTVSVLWQSGSNTGAVHANDPIGLGAGVCRITERSVTFTGFPLFIGLKHGVVGHRLHPHAGCRCFDFGVFDDGTENQFTFSGCIACIDNFRDGFILYELHDGGELFLCSSTFWLVLK